MQKKNSNYQKIVLQITIKITNLIYINQIKITCKTNMIDQKHPIQIEQIEIQ